MIIEISKKYLSFGLKQFYSGRKQCHNVYIRKTSGGKFKFIINQIIWIAIRLRCSTSAGKSTLQTEKKKVKRIKLPRFLLQKKIKSCISTRKSVKKTPILKDSFVICNVCMCKAISPFKKRIDIFF